jgi:glucose dehydrogenase
VSASKHAPVRAIAVCLLFVLSGANASFAASLANAAPNAAAALAAAPVAAATPLSQAEANWAYPNGNAFAQDYNPQNQINSSNAQYLGLNWLFPLPSRPTPLLSYGGSAGLGVDAAVLLVNGTIYAITQFDQVFALNAATGDLIWTDILPIDLNSSAGTNTGALVLHNHDGVDQFTTSLFGHTPTLWLQAADEKVWAIDALTGAYELNFTDFSGINMVMGNNPISIYKEVGASNILVDQTRGILISSQSAESISDNGRCFYRGWDVLFNPPTPLWTAYCSPPQPGSNVSVDPNWSMKSVGNMSSAEIFYPGVTSTNGYTTPAEVAGGVQFNTNNNLVVQLKDLSQSQLNATLYDDWGQVNQSAQCQAITGGASTGSTGAGWGGAWLLGSGPTSGMAFVNTNNKDPWVGPCNPGPDLWSASILALNVTNGHWIWGFQATAHDLWDYDCSWWQGMGNETVNGVSTQVLWKTCKNGYLYEINALTGNLVWAWSPPTSMIPRCPTCYMWNPLNRTMMTQEFFTPNNQPALQYPSDAAGFEDEQAYSPATNTLFVAAHIVPGYVIYLGLNSSTYFSSTGERVTPINRGSCPDCKASNNNATVFAIDAATGKINWSYFIPLQGYRGGVTTSGNIVFLTLSSGDMLMLNARTGLLVKDYNIGGPLNVLPTVGATADGQVEVIVPVTAGIVTWAPGGVPGDLVALGLQSVPGDGVTTVTKTTTATVVSTSVSGVSATTAYAITVVAVIFIIATGYLAMRGRKPAS